MMNYSITHLDSKMAEIDNILQPKYLLMSQNVSNLSAALMSIGMMAASYNLTITQKPTETYDSNFGWLVIKMHAEENVDITITLSSISSISLGTLYDLGDMDTSESNVFDHSKSAAEVANDKASSTKVFRNGMLLIKNGDKIYNVMGVEIK